MGKWCLYASSFIFDRTIIKTAGNQDRHKSSDMFDFGPLVSMAHLHVFWNEIWPWHIGLTLVSDHCPLGYLLVGPFVCFHTSCVRTAKALARLRGCAGSPEPLLVAYVISTIISWAGYSPWRSDSNGYMILWRTEENSPLIVIKYPPDVFLCQEGTLLPP